MPRVRAVVAVAIGLGVLGVLGVLLRLAVASTVPPCPPPCPCPWPPPSAGGRRPAGSPPGTRPGGREPSPASPWRPRRLDSTTAPTMAASRVTPADSKTSIEPPSSSWPRAAIGSAGGLTAPTRAAAGKSANRATAARARKLPAPATTAVLSWCTMFIGLSPAGFIMNMTMKRAITIISTAIMKTSAKPR